MSAYIPKSKATDWATPQKLFDALNKRFKFTLDVAADAMNAKCPRFFDVQTDGLAQTWRNTDGSPATVWCNPPYGRVIREWVSKARKSADAGDATVVMLLPARTDTKWFHDDVINNDNAEIEFIKGRLKFGGCLDPAPFPSLIVIFNRNKGGK